MKGKSVPIDPRRLLDTPVKEVRQSYTRRDTMLYALGVGLGADPTDENQLRFVYEKDLAALPTMAVVLGADEEYMHNPNLGVDWSQALHGEEYLTLHAPLPVEGTVLCRLRIAGISDKGAGKGMVLAFERKLSDAGGRPLATSITTAFCRTEGGYARTPGEAVMGELPPRLAAVPEGPPDAVVELPTLPQAALIYRLSGDYTDFHADPAAARKAGFARPFLQGLCTYGVAGHALLKGICGYDAARLRCVAARFSSVVFPGEALAVEMWRRGGEVSFRVWARDRKVKVLDNGQAVIA